MRHRYDRLAHEYDRRWTRYVAASAEGMLARIDLEGVRDALDVGCGSGVLLGRIARARPGIRLVGIDLSPAMLAEARAERGREIGFVAASAARLPFRSTAFGLVLSASALHYWRDPAGAFVEMRRVMRPGGRIAITDWCADYLLDRLRDRVLRVVEPAHHRTLRAAELAALLTEAGYGDVRVERWQIGFRWGLMTATATAP